jgi:hypothetical protein
LANKIKKASNEEVLEFFKDDHVKQEESLESQQDRKFSAANSSPLIYRGKEEIV